MVLIKGKTLKIIFIVISSLQSIWLLFEIFLKQSLIDNGNNCPRCIVYSANHIPLKAVGYFKSLVDEVSNWYCVSVLNKRSIELEYAPLKSDRFIVLTLEDQAELSNTASNSSLGTKIPLGNNIGDMYAISHGARLIYDTREDTRLEFGKNSALRL